METVRQTKAKYPQVEFLAHPECTEEILAEADFIGSTSDIIGYAEKSSKKEFLIGTEDGVFAELMKKCPEKKLLFCYARTVLCRYEKSQLLRRCVTA